MADTSKSIKSATDKELNDLLVRIRMECEALRLLRELKLKSISNPNGPYPSSSTTEAFSTETDVSNGKSIKGMTDQELRDFITRLQKEIELARIVFDIKEMNNPVKTTTFEYSEEEKYEGISLDTPIKDLYHWGIRGMRWGVRRATGSDGRVSSGGKAKKGSEDYQKARDLKKKGYKNLSDNELKALTNRMNLERNFRDLKSSDTQRGLDFLKTATAIGTTVASAYALSQTPLGKSVITAIKERKYPKQISMFK